MGGGRLCAPDPAARPCPLSRRSQDLVGNLASHPESISPTRFNSHLFNKFDPCPWHWDACSKSIMGPAHHRDKCRETMSLSSPDPPAAAVSLRENPVLTTVSTAARSPPHPHARLPLPSTPTQALGPRRCSGSSHLRPFTVCPKRVAQWPSLGHSRCIASPRPAG